MYFSRYEIRWYIQRCFYEGGDTMEYKPFETLKEANEYIKANQSECKGATLYLVKYYPNHESTKEVYNYHLKKNEVKKIITNLVNTIDKDKRIVFIDWAKKQAKHYGLLKQLRSEGVNLTDN